MILLLDNYDSFTYNLAQYLWDLGAELRVVRNDAVTVRDVAAMAPDGIVISPGPGRPESAGATLDLLASFGATTPILGVCLGMQAIGQAYGGRVVPGPAPVHGRASQVRHDGSGLFRGLPNPMAAGRYHSLVVQEAGLPRCLEVTARSEDGVVMGLRHRDHPVEGVQFHPESVLTPDGRRMLQNFLERVNGR